MAGQGDRRTSVRGPGAAQAKDDRVCGAGREFAIARPRCRGASSAEAAGTIKRSHDSEDGLKRRAQTWQASFAMPKCIRLFQERHYHGAHSIQSGAPACATGLPGVAAHGFSRGGTNPANGSGLEPAFHPHLDAGVLTIRLYEGRAMGGPAVMLLHGFPMTSTLMSR